MPIYLKPIYQRYKDAAQADELDPLIVVGLGLSSKRLSQLNGVSD